MLDDVIREVCSEVSGDRVLGDTREIHCRDRWFTTPKFLESAGYAAGRLKESGAADARVLKFRADGKTLYGAWRAPLAWDVASARLTVVEPAAMAGTVLADYQAVPCSLVMWSGPTPKGGVTAEVVAVGPGGSETHYRGRNVRGKIVFAAERASAAKGLAARRGAVGVLSDYLPAAETLPDAVFWNNAFNDVPSAWGATAGGSGLFGFGVSPNVGRRLRRVLAAGGRLKLHAVSDTRLHAGPLPVATGSIPGRQPGEEVLVLGHGFEQGARDNAAGAACMIEAVRALDALIRAGRLPRPRRAIRALVTNECFGTIGYVQRHRRRVRGTVAALCLDEVAIDVVTGRAVQGLHANPHSNASYVDTFARRLAEAVWDGRHFNPWRMLPYGMTDNLIAHSTIGVPTIWVGGCGASDIWHTSADTPDRLDPAQLEAAVAYVACYLYTLADAGAAEARWLARHAAADAQAQLHREAVDAAAEVAAQPKAGRRRIAEGFAARAAYLCCVHGKAVRGAARLARGAERRRLDADLLALVADVGELAKELAADVRAAAGLKAPDALAVRSPFRTVSHAPGDRVRPVSNYLGPVTYDPIAPADRAGHADPRWGGPVNCALGWANGWRTLNEVVALTEHETGRPLPDLAEELHWLIGKGMVRDAAKSRRRRS